MRKTGRKLLYAVADNIIDHLEELSDHDLRLLRKTAKSIKQHNWWFVAHDVAPVVASLADAILDNRACERRMARKEARDAR